VIAATVSSQTKGILTISPRHRDANTASFYRGRAQLSPAIDGSNESLQAYTLSNLVKTLGFLVSRFANRRVGGWL
jgi:hypothetical protein